MKIISKILEEQEVTKEDLPEDVNEGDIPFFKRASITFMDVKRSFFAF